MNAPAHAHAHGDCCSTSGSCRCEHCGCAQGAWIKAFTPGLAVGVILGAFIGVAVSEFGGARLAPARPEPGVASTVTRDQAPPAEDADDAHAEPTGGH